MAWWLTFAVISDQLIIRRRMHGMVANFRCYPIDQYPLHVPTRLERLAPSLSAIFGAERASLSDSARLVSVPHATSPIRFVASLLYTAGERDASTPPDRAAMVAEVHRHPPSQVLDNLPRYGSY
jgi:hypothetical protein